MKRKLDYEICKNLRDARQSKGLSLSEASSKIGISKQSLIDYEGGRGNPTLLTLIEICKTYEVTPNYIISGNDDNAKSFNDLITKKLYNLCSLAIDGDISYNSDNFTIEINSKKLKDSFALAFQLTRDETLSKLEISDRVLDFLQNNKDIF